MFKKSNYYRADTAILSISSLRFNALDSWLFWAAWINSCVKFISYCLSLEWAEFKDYIWLFPSIGAILVGISLFTPAAYLSTGLGSVFVWRVGFALLTGGGYGPETDFFDIADIIFLELLLQYF